MIINQKVFISHLDIMPPPLPRSGGRVVSTVGEIAQMPDFISVKHLAYIDFKENPNIIRGNHYHLDKDEYLYVIKGKLKAIYEDIETKEREEFLFITGDLINNKPKVAHAFIPLEFTQLIEFAPTIFDPIDTIKYKVI